MAFGMSDWIRRHEQDVTQSRVSLPNHQIDRMTWSPLIPEQAAKVRAQLDGLLTRLMKGETLSLLAEPERWEGKHHDGPPFYDDIGRRYLGNYYVRLQRIGRSDRKNPELRSMRMDRQFGAQLHTAEANFVGFQREGDREIFQGMTPIRSGGRFIMEDPSPNSSLLVHSGNCDALLTSVMPIEKMHPLPIDASGFRDLSRSEVNEMIDTFQFQYQAVAYG